MAPTETTPTATMSYNDPKVLAPDLAEVEEAGAVVEVLDPEPELVLVELLVLNTPPIAIPLLGTSERVVFAAPAAYAARVFGPEVGSFTTITIPFWQWVRTD